MKDTTCAGKSSAFSENGRSLPDITLPLPMLFCQSPFMTLDFQDMMASFLCSPIISAHLLMRQNHVSANLAPHPHPKINTLFLATESRKLILNQVWRAFTTQTSLWCGQKREKLFLGSSKMGISKIHSKTWAFSGPPDFETL